VILRWYRRYCMSVPDTSPAMYQTPPVFKEIFVAVSVVSETRLMPNQWYLRHRWYYNSGVSDTFDSLKISASLNLKLKIILGIILGSIRGPFIKTRGRKSRATRHVFSENWVENDEEIFCVIKRSLYLEVGSDRNVVITILLQLRYYSCLRYTPSLPRQLCAHKLSRQYLEYSNSESVKIPVNWRLLANIFFCCLWKQIFVRKYRFSVQPSDRFIPSFCPLFCIYPIYLLN
jgi:hypothetical protein